MYIYQSVLGTLILTADYSACTYDQYVELTAGVTGRQGCSHLLDTRPHRHKTFEYSQGNFQLKYLSQRMVELEISSTLLTFSDLSMYSSD
jgi:hypothetical protein